MTEKRAIGEILTKSGRITAEDVAVALEHQSRHGGYFGEALLACGLVTQEELDWGLASQADLPYVFPDADAVDVATASLVSAEWALSNHTLPILRTDDSLKVVVDSPLRTDAFEFLRDLTGLEVDLSLASPTAIREVIRQVYARATAAEVEHHAPLALHEALDAILLVEAPRFGVSVRGGRASAWWSDHGTIRRRPLSGDWRSELDMTMVPSASEMTAGQSRTSWEAELHRAGAGVPVHIDYIGDESGREYLFHPRPEGVTLEERFPPPSEGVVSEVQLLARSGTARFVVTTEPAELGHEILAHLPTLLLDAWWRSIYISAREQAAAGEAFSVQLPDDPTTWPAEIEALRGFHFDVVTVDLSGGGKSWTASALDIASVAFLLWEEGEDLTPAREAGVRWRLAIRREEGNGLEWSLGPLDE